MSFAFKYLINSELQITSGKLMECRDADCSDGTPLEHLGPQNFGCSSTSCSSMAYGYSQYHQLVIEFSDGVTRTSNVFTKNKFAADFEVSVYADHLDVVELPGGVSWSFTGNTALDLLIGAVILCLATANIVFLVLLLVKAGKPEASFKAQIGWYIAAWIVAVPTFLISLILTQGLVTTLVVELVLGAVYCTWRKRPLVLVLTVIFMINLFTQPALWLTISGFSGHYPVILVIFVETIVTLVEAAGVFMTLRKRIGFGEALIFSLVLNAASFGIGLLLPL